MSSFLLSLIISVTIIFTFLNHPMAMGLALLVQTCLIALLTGSLSNFCWFAYILFLVFLGGLLVLFIYITSLASNEMFSLSSLAMVLAPTIFLFSIVYSSSALLMDYASPSFTNLEFLSTVMENSEVQAFVTKLYSSYTHILTLLLAGYLFLTLIVVVTITDISSGPLRPYGN